MEFRNAIFAGGGSRCFWQMGFWKGANAAGLDLSGTVKYAAGVSAGCASATAAMLDRCDEALEVFVQLTSRNPRNVHWWNLKPGSTGPLLPHMNMYREGLKTLLTPSDLDALSHKHVEFLMARFPRFLPSAIGTLSAFVTYGIEKRVTGRLHPLWTRRMGFKPLTAGNHEAADIADLMDAILASSCVPPVLPTKGYRGYRILDGGVIDNVPAFLADGRPGSTLVLLSKRYRRPLPGPAQRVYVQPSQPIEIDKFDYANPSGLEKIFDLGKADGAQFAKSHLLSARQGTAVIRENGLHADGGQPR